MKTMTRALENILGKVENDIKKGKNMSPAFSSAEKANEYLDKDTVLFSEIGTHSELYS